MLPTRHVISLGAGRSSSRQSSRHRSTRDSLHMETDSGTTVRARLWTCRGLSIETLREGDGVNVPQPGQTVAVHYTTMLTNGRVIGSSLERGKALRFTVGEGRVIQGLDIAVMRMSVGERIRLTVAPELAYHTRGLPPLIPPCATLILTVDLLSFAATLNLRHTTQ